MTQQEERKKDMTFKDVSGGDEAVEASAVSLNGHSLLFYFFLRV